MVDIILSKETQPLPSPQLADLTFREWEILLLVSEDKSNDEIALMANLKVESIRTMRNRIGDKLMLKGRLQLCIYSTNTKNQRYTLR